MTDWFEWTKTIIVKDFIWLVELFMAIGWRNYVEGELNRKLYREALIEEILRRGEIRRLPRSIAFSIPCLKGLIIDSLIPTYITKTLGESNTLIPSIVLLGKGEKEAKRILKSITGYRYCEIVAHIKKKNVMRLLLYHLMNAFVIVIFFVISSCEGSWLMKILLILHKNRVVAEFIEE